MPMVASKAFHVREVNLEPSMLPLQQSWYADIVQHI